MVVFLKFPMRPVAPSNTFIPQLDAGSVSTFGTIKDAHQEKNPPFPENVQPLVLLAQLSLQ